MFYGALGVAVLIGISSANERPGIEIQSLVAASGDYASDLSSTDHPGAPPPANSAHTPDEAEVLRGKAFSEVSTAKKGHDMEVTGGPYEKCPESDAKVTKAQLDVIIPEMQDRHVRLRHALWHWGSEGLSAEDNEAITEAFGKGWSSPHPGCPFPKNNAFSSKEDAYNPHGENFLFMHREMFAHINQKLKDAQKPCIGGWTKIPASNDRNWPVPGHPADKSGAKSDETLQYLNDWLSMFNDKQWLSQHSLSQLGKLIEVTIHNNMHMRWTVAGKCRNNNFPVEREFLFNDKYPPGWKNDERSNNCLGDPYSAHVNPVFWKLHGLVDNLIEKWAWANGYKEVASNCKTNGKRRPKCYEFQGRWAGGEFHKPSEDKPEQEPKTRSSSPDTPEVAQEKKKKLDRAAEIVATKSKEGFSKHAFEGDLKNAFNRDVGPKAPKTRVDPKTRAQGIAQVDKTTRDRWKRMENLMVRRLCPA